MNRTEDDMKHVGFFGIFNQSFRAIFSYKRIFSLITLAFIFPLATILIIHFEISYHHFWRIHNNSLPYDTNDSREATSLEWLYYLLFSLASLIFIAIFSVLSTIAVVFSVASVYTNRDVTFRDVTKCIPKVWMRVLITFICIYIAQVVYDVIVRIIMAIARAVLGFTSVSLVVMIIILILLIFPLLYLTVVCQLASVVTVLEDDKGFDALKKGKALASGKKSVGMGIAFVLSALFAGLVIVYLLFVEFGDDVFNWALIWRVLMGILCGLLFLGLLLVVIVVQTVLYLVCKSYHREAIDKMGLSTFLAAYATEAVVYPRSGEEIQLGRTQDPAQPV
ncbi:uncharacterized protein LOC143555699 [Bidens hawaiensis]|uniref:uncharacterized protein LOC143555699 n=1 Tax=Bidens hawaiensis TaxID=980011 RepID=UPI00404B1D4E